MNSSQYQKVQNPLNVQYLHHFEVKYCFFDTMETNTDNLKLNKFEPASLAIGVDVLLINSNIQEYIFYLFYQIPSRSVKFSDDITECKTT